MRWLVLMMLLVCGLLIYPTDLIQTKALAQMSGGELGREIQRRILEEAEKERERRAKLTPEQREAEDRARAEDEKLRAEAEKQAAEKKAQEEAKAEAAEEAGAIKCPKNVIVKNWFIGQGDFVNGKPEKISHIHVWIRTKKGELRRLNRTALDKKDRMIVSRLEERLLKEKSKKEQLSEKPLPST